ncbi:hypothetical protein ATI61_106479 [Archangium gephyra]|uniref:Uncharacterized protein n=2 Tax=Archangium gephyra TaxID=48 RepID=A0ABX9K0V7_9BACT|nr:hypothetical protein ATI61_106479 [Archangium gephyra]
MNARIWLAAFREEYTAKDATGAMWTTHMFEVLHRMQHRFAMHCLCEHGDGKHHEPGEALEIDLMWFKRNGGTYDVPLLALEHENSYLAAEAKKDFWRVFQVAAPLRVFIGYSRNNPEQRLEELVTLRSKGWQGDLFHRLQGGEDIALVGQRGMGGFNSWYGAVWSGNKVHRLHEFLRSRLQQ